MIFVKDCLRQGDLWSFWSVGLSWIKGPRDSLANSRKRENRELFTEWLCCWTCPSCSLRTSGRVTTLLPQPLPTWIRSSEVDLSFGSETRQGSTPSGMGRKKLWNEKTSKKRWLTVILSPPFSYCPESLSCLLDTCKMVKTRSLNSASVGAQGSRGRAWGNGRQCESVVLDCLVSYTKRFENHYLGN